MAFASDKTRQGAAGVSTGYDIDNSLRFNDDDSAYLSRTPSSAGNRRTWTWSGWVKRGNLGSEQVLFTATETSSNRSRVMFNSANQLKVNLESTGSVHMTYETTSLYRDPSAWYHVVLAVDTTQAGAVTDRFDLYVNGVSITSWATEVSSSWNQNIDLIVNNTEEHSIGSFNYSTGSSYLDGYLAEVHFIDGTALDPTSFGETGTYGEWKAKKVSGLTYGTNGFYLDFKNSGLIGADNKDTVDIFGDSSGIALYRFEDNVNDASGNYNGTATSITYSTDGVYTKCGVLNGSSSYLDYSSTNIQNVFEGASGAGSVSIWFKPTTVTSSSMNLFAISTGSFSAGSDYWIVNYNSSGIYQDWRSNESGDTYESSAQLTASISAGIWYNLVITYNAGSFNYYLDGSSIGSRSTSVRFSNLTECQSGRYGTDAAFANCSLDNIRFFNKALSSSEVAELSNTNLGLDEAGTNNWTANNLASTDQMVDTPTNNFCTLNPIYSGGTDLSQGNLRTVLDYYNTNNATGTISVSTGKWYCESYVESGDRAILGFVRDDYDADSDGLAYDSFTNSVGYYGDGSYYTDSTRVDTFFAAWVTGDIIGIALNLDSDEISFYKNNVLQVATQSYTFDGGWVFSAQNGSFTEQRKVINFGQDSSFAGNKTAQGNQDGGGIGDFYYTPPSGFLALCTKNLPDPAVIPSEHFNTVTYSGDGTTGRSITGVGFQPDFTWIKNRTTTDWHNLYDVIRGATKRLYTNDASLEETSATALTSFDTDGFTTGSNTGTNGNTNAIVAWNWKAGGAGVSNTSGSITSTVSANADAGFSIVSYTGNGTGGATVGHGLDYAPEIIIIKNRDDSTTNWNMWGSAIGTTQEYLYLNTTAAKNSGSSSYGCTLSSTTIELSATSAHRWRNASGDKYIAYCFHSVDGYSKVGSYTGNGSSDGTFVYTGFRPAYLLMKRTSSAADWYLFDSARNTYNVMGERLKASSSTTGYTGTYLDFTSNGFKWRLSGSQNQSGVDFIYLAFAESPFKHTNAR